MRLCLAPSTVLALALSLSVVPAGAVQWTNSSPVVFVRGEDGASFQIRTVRVGLRTADYIEITDGIQPGEVVATTGSHVLKSAQFQSEGAESDKD